MHSKVWDQWMKLMLSFSKDATNYSKHVTKDFYNAPFTRGVCVNAWRRACLKLGADATVIVTTANHITFLVLHEWDWLASALGYLHKAIWLADACIIESFQLLPRATPVKQRDGSTIPFGNAWRHSSQSKREVLMSTPRVNAVLLKFVLIR